MTARRDDDEGKRQHRARTGLRHPAEAQPRGVAPVTRPMVTV